MAEGVQVDSPRQNEAVKALGRTILTNNLASLFFKAPLYAGSKCRWYSTIFNFLIFRKPLGFNFLIFRKPLVLWAA
jgi:hypothetical protein